MTEIEIATEIETEIGTGTEIEIAGTTATGSIGTEMVTEMTGESIATAMTASLNASSRPLCIQMARINRFLLPATVMQLLRFGDDLFRIPRHQSRASAVDEKIQILQGRSLR